MIIERPELLSILQSYYNSIGAEIEEINLFGIQFPEDQDKDIWNDFLGIWTSDGQVYIWQGTTDPGKNATENKEGGAAHLCLGFHKDIWGIGMHPQKPGPWQHLALVQRNGMPCRIWRDENRDYKDNDDKIETGYFGINSHRASKVENVPVIGPYSEGCQVTWNIQDFDFHMNVIIQSSKVTNNPNCKFSYLLLDHFEAGMLLQ